MVNRAPLVIGIDLGTTKIVAIAIDCGTGAILARHALPNDAMTTRDADRARGWSEWNADRIVTLGVECLTYVARDLGERAVELAAIGITGQQHGMLLATQSYEACSPLINWQDRRGLETAPGEQRTYVQLARDAMDANTVHQIGCQLQSGFMAVTLVWLKMHNRLPSNARACFIMDYFASRITGERSAADPSCCGSAGVLDVRTRQWHHDAIRSLGLTPALFPDVGEANQRVGVITSAVAQATGLPASTPVFVPIGDHQASFAGSVANSLDTALVNVGTGAQVAAFTDDVDFEPPIELRPFPLNGNLLSNVGLPGGWSYQVLEGFLHDVGIQFRAPSDSAAGRAKMYDQMNRLAASIAPGSDGLRCRPTFSGTRGNPQALGELTGISAQNLTAAHLCRAVLEGMAHGYQKAYDEVCRVLNRKHSQLVGAGNGLRSNSVLVESIENAFQLPMRFSAFPEEAAFGAALFAAVASGVFTDLTSAGKLIRYDGACGTG